MDRRTTLAIVLSFLIFFGWQKLYLEKHMPTQQTTQQTATTAQATAPTGMTATPQSTTSGTVTPPKAKEKRPSLTLPIQLETGVAKVSDGNKFFTSWDLKSYHTGVAANTALVDLQSVTNQAGVGELSFDAPEYAYLSGEQGTLTQTANGVLWSYEDQNIKLTREMVGGPNQAFIDMKINAEFKTKKPTYAFVSMASKSVNKDAEAQDRQLVYWTNKSIERVPLNDTFVLKDVVTPVKWIGATNRYFLTTFVSGEGTEGKGLVQPLSAGEGRISLVYPIAGNTVSIPVRAYFGPKELNLLRSVEPSLDHTIDFGWFTVFAYPLLKVMKWFYGIFHNYGIAIILLTLLVKILTFPLTYKSMKSMKQMAKLQPQLTKIREKYKDDKEALNREMLTVMRTHGYNPMAGCLPILIQMPVFFALYRVLYSSIELYHAPFYFWILDLSAKDPFYVTPILLTLTMYIQQKLTPTTTTDPVQAKMLQFMPVIFGGFMLTLPAGLTIYMLVNAIASIVQQLYLNKKLDIGHATTPVAAR